MILALLATAPDETLEEGGSAGYIALLIVVLLGIALVFLIRNMNGRLRRLPRTFDAPTTPTTPTTPPDDRLP